MQVASHLRRHWPVLLLLVGVALLYGRTVEYPFVNWDDPLHVYRNPAILEPSELTCAERWMPRHLGYPMPVTIGSYRLDAALHLSQGAKVGIGDGAGFHLTNLLIALVMTLSAYLLCVVLVGNRWAALLAAGLFAAHPLVVEPVAWISGRKDLLSATLSLIAVGAWWRYLHAGRRPWQLALFGLLGAAAMMSKPNAVYLVPFVLYLGWCVRLPGGVASEPIARGPGWRGVAVVGLLAVGALALVWVARDWNRAVGGVQSDFGFAQTLRRVVWTLGFHSRLVVAPTILRPKYLVEPGAFDLYDLAGVVVIVGSLALLLWRGCRGKAASAGLALFVLSYLPNSSVIPLRRHIADTYLLLPLLGLCIVAGAALRWLLERGPRVLRAPAVAAVVLLIAGLGTLSHFQLPIWGESTRLWARAMHFHPEQPKFCRMLGHAHNENGDHRQAIVTYRECARRHGWALVANNVAISHYLLGEYDRAEQLLRRILTHKPEDPRALKYLRLIEARRKRTAPTTAPTRAPDQDGSARSR